MSRPFIVWRLIEVIGALTRAIVVSSFLAVRPRKPRAVALREALEQLGAAWIKLGQWLSLRFDLLPSDYCSELLNLHSEAKPAEFAALREVFRQEQGRYPEDVFAEIERAPFVSTVLHHLHQVRDREGNVLVVKIQRPETARALASDIQLMRLLAKVYDFFRKVGSHSATSLIDSFALGLSNEIDYRVPARIIGRRSQFLDGGRSEATVEVCAAYSSRRVLTTRFVGGVSLLDIMRARQRGDDAYLRSLGRRGYDIGLIARRLHRNMLNQVYRDGLFHADMSPTSVIVLPGNAITYVDFGMMGYLQEDLKDSVRFFMSSMLSNKLDRAIDELVRWCVPSSVGDLPGFRNDMIRIMEAYLDDFRSSTAHPAIASDAHFAMRLLTTLRRYKLSVSDDVALYLRALLTTETIVLELAPQFDLPNESGRFFMNAAVMDTLDGLSPVRIYQSVAGSIRTASRLLGSITDLQRSGSAIGLSLRTLKVRLFEYGLWALLTAGAAYAAYTGQILIPVENLLGISREWMSFGFLVCALLLFFMMWRQGRKLLAMDRTTISRSEVFLRSRGRVR